MGDFILTKTIDLPDQQIITFINQTGENVIFEIDDGESYTKEFIEPNIKLSIHKSNHCRKIHINVKCGEEIIYAKRFIIEKKWVVDQEESIQPEEESVEKEESEQWNKKIKLNDTFSHNNISTRVIEKLKLNGGR